MKKLTYYHETQMLLQFVAENFPDYRTSAVMTMLKEMVEELQEEIERSITIKDLALRCCPPLD